MTSTTSETHRHSLGGRGGGAGFGEAHPTAPTGTTVFVPMRFHRRSGRTLAVIQPAGAAPTPTPVKPPNPIQLALARAFRWRGRLEAGEFPTHRDLARHLGLGRSYVSRLMRLTLLAPDIVAALADAREPSGLSLDRLLHADLPDDWPGQRKALGFPDDG